MGKRWNTRVMRERTDGGEDLWDVDVRVAGRETIEVPAGKFETYLIKAQGWRIMGSYQQRQNGRAKHNKAGDLSACLSWWGLSQVWLNLLRSGTQHSGPNNEHGGKANAPSQRPPCHQNQQPCGGQWGDVAQNANLPCIAFFERCIP